MQLRVIASNQYKLFKKCIYYVEAYVFNDAKKTTQKILK